jgi:Protein of unknown function (DUF3429)
MNEKLSLTTRARGGAGLLPFIAVPAAFALGPPSRQDQSARALGTYGAAIVSLPGGVRWGAPTDAAHDSARLWAMSSLLAWPMLPLRTAAQPGRRCLLPARCLAGLKNDHLPYRAA